MEFKIINRYVKSATKAKLKQNWPIAISFILMILIANLFFSIISQMLMTMTNIEYLTLNYRANLSMNSIAITTYIYLLSLIILIPLRLGIKSWFTKIGNTNTPTVKATKAFVYFSSPRLYLKSMCVKISVMLRNLIVFIVALSPAFAINIILKISWKNQYQVLDFMYFCFAFLAICFIILGLSLAIIQILNFFFVEYLFIRFENIKISTAFKCSKHLIKNRKRELFLLFLTMLPHLLSCILVIPFIFVAPYIKKIYAEYALGIINEQHEYITEMINNNNKKRS